MEKEKNIKWLNWVLALIPAISLISIIVILFPKDKFAYKFSELKIEDYYIVGKMQNTSNKKCGLLSVHYILKSGDIEEEGSFSLLDINEKKTYNIQEFAFDMEDYENENYKIKVTKVWCMDED